MYSDCSTNNHEPVKGNFHLVVSSAAVRLLTSFSEMAFVPDRFYLDNAAVFLQLVRIFKVDQDFRLAIIYIIA